jgi:hypothetical protein|tara:strand:+ start:634 stop:1659 length:1026 start_codon:yes stop_codon:yes gene_type:complete
MSEIKLQKSKTAEAGTDFDIDHEDVPFNKLTLNVVHPVSKQEIYIEYNKSDSKDVLVEKEDGTYVEEADVKYLKESWEATEYSFFLENSTLRHAEEGDLGDGVKNFAVPKSTNTYDEVYVNKKLVRTDYNIGLWQSDKLIEEVEKVFGKDQEWKSNRFNIIGTYTAHEDAPLRPPYTHEKTYSWYNVYNYPSQELLDEFKVPDVGYEYHVWHSIKYNTVTGKKQLKLVIADNEYTSNYQKHPDTFIPRPEVPLYSAKYRSFFFAKIFNEDGTEADQYDVFFVTTKDIMKEFCKEKGLDFPMPETREDDFVWIYGLVYDKNTLEIKQVKGYVRYPTEEGEWL